MRIFFSVGEPSGDLHGANLIRRLKSQERSLETVGFGGPRMAAEGCQLLEDLTQLAVMWFLTVALRLHRFYKLYRQAQRYFRQHQVDAVVLIDYPGFNWWVARAARQAGIPVYYYGVPQMWAWAPWRIRKMRRLVNHALCKLPFEAEWYRQRGVDAQFVGHPYYDEIAERTIDSDFVRAEQAEAPLIALLPGSRSSEVAKNTATLLRAAQRIHKELGGELRGAGEAPRVRFAAACFNQRQAERFQEIARREAPELPVTVHVGRTPELIAAARACIACSGSVSLELMCAAKPSVIVYRVTFPQYLLARLLVKVKYITLVNLLAMDDRFECQQRPYDPDAPGAERVPMPEYPSVADQSPRVASHVIAWLRDPAAYRAAVQRLEGLRQEFAQPGATARAADYLLGTLGAAPARAPRAA